MENLVSSLGEKTRLTFTSKVSVLIKDPFPAPSQSMTSPAVMSYRGVQSRTLMFPLRQQDYY